MKEIDGPYAEEREEEMDYQTDSLHKKFPREKGKHSLMTDLPLKVLQANIKTHRKNHGHHLK